MEAFWRLLGMGQAPSRVDTDDVYPTHLLDDISTYHDITHAWLLRFDDVLDAEKLHVSLEKLLEKGDWKKLGGRFKHNVKGKLELHVPAEFTPQRPAVAYSHETVDVNIEDHPLAKALPEGGTEPFIYTADPAVWRPFAVLPDTPATLKEHVSKDVPAISLRITSFNDATIIGLSFSHVLMDAMGQQAFLQAWSLMVAGRDDEVPELLGARDDVLFGAEGRALLKERGTEELAMEHKRLRGFGSFWFVLRFVWDMLMYPAETRTIFLPSSAISKLRKMAETDLLQSAKEEGNGDTTGKAPFVSDGDIITAWAVRADVTTLTSPRPVTVYHSVDPRGRVPSLKNAPGVYMQNMVLAAYTCLSAEAAQGSLGQIALANRRELAKQVSESQLLAQLREVAAGAGGVNGDPQIFCADPDAALLCLSSWARADILRAADFSAAVIRAGDKRPSRKSPPGFIVAQHVQGMRSSMVVRNLMTTTSKNHSGGYSIVASLTKAQWAALEKSIKELRNMA